MNADRLLAHYEKIADAPEAIPRLRRFILALAVRGKLVPQDPSDEPALELLKRIAAEKVRLVKAGELRKPRELDVGEGVVEPYLIPSTWRWVRLDGVGAIVGGGTPSASDADNFSPPGDGTPWLTPADLGGYTELHISRGSRDLSEKGVRTSSATLMPKGTVLFTSRAPIGYVAIAANPISTNQGFKSIVPYVGACSHFIAVAMQAFAPEIDAKAPGTTFKEVSGKIIAAVPFPLPPLAEQHRIVAKVDELMGLCDRLEKARATREATRDQLAAACLTRLNRPDAKTFQIDARFALDALLAFTKRPDQIKALRQTILNLAVRGKLVPQDPNDEPASELLKRIAKEKVRLFQAGEIAREKPIPPLTEADNIFELPQGWVWARLGQLSKLVTSGSRDWAKHYSNEGAIFVRMGNLSKDHYRLRLDHIQRVKPPVDSEGTRTRLESGDILISITGEVGMLGLIPEGFGEAYINQHTAMVRPIDEMKGKYLPELFRSAFAQAQFNEPQRGIKNSFRLTDVTQFVVPLPPLAEQKRIVAKVDELMALCDRLEASLATADENRRRLLEALLAEALAPAENRAMAAAE